VAFAVPGHAMAADAQEKAQAEARLKALQKQIRKAKETLEANKARYSSAARDLAEAEKRVAQAARELRQTRQQLVETGRRLEQLKSRQALLEKQKRAQQDSLARQIRAAYANGESEYLKILLNLDDPASLNRMLTYFRFLSEARRREIAALIETLQALEQVASDIEDKRQQLAGLVARKEQQMAKMLRLKKEREAAVVAWKTYVDRAGKRLNNLLADQKELQSLVEALRQAIEVFMPSESLEGLGRLRGKLRWPVKGRMLARFGSERHQGKMSWQGVLLATSEGRPVHTITAGRVVFADWLRGYGLLTIVDHGKGYMSLYGHNQTLLKQVGDWVEPGEVIALAGNTGGLTSPALYFEIRYKNRPVNPALWCR
jgi:septal ring factor EnvC (AmiA/AmiB activator)